MDIIISFIYRWAIRKRDILQIYNNKVVAIAQPGTNSLDVEIPYYIFNVFPDGIKFTFNSVYKDKYISKDQFIIKIEQFIENGYFPMKKE